MLFSVKLFFFFFVEKCYNYNGLYFQFLYILKTIKIINFANQKNLVVQMLFERSKRFS